MSTLDLSAAGPDYFEDESLTDLSLEEQIIRDKSFYNCTFTNGSLHKTQFIGCLFEECTFMSCDLSAAKFNDSRFVEVLFKHSKATGINWTELRETIQPPQLSFEDCVLNYSSFMDMKIKDARFTDCIAHEVSFQGAQLSDAVFKNTDLAGAQFNYTDLQGADFTTARNYYIHPGENKVRGARFTFPEVQALLSPFGIVIDNE